MWSTFTRTDQCDMGRTLKGVCVTRVSIHVCMCVHVRVCACVHTFVYACVHAVCVHLCNLTRGLSINLPSFDNLIVIAQTFLFTSILCA